MQDFRTAVREAVHDEAALRGALAEADIAPMLMVLVQLTGDLDFLDEVAPYIHGPWSFLQAVSEPLKQDVRDRLVAALQDYAADDRPAPPQPHADVLQRMMGAGVGQTVPGRSGRRSSGAGGMPAIASHRGPLGEARTV